MKIILELQLEYHGIGAYNCYNKGKITSKPSNISQYGGPAGISGCGANGGAIINCCSLGTLRIIGSKGTYDRTAVLSKLGSATITNSYYLNGVPGNTGINVASQEPNAVMFYKTSEDENAMTTAKVVQALNDYIESNPSGVSTSGWCKWEVGEDNLPALDFTKEWDGTSWVTVSN